MIRHRLLSFLISASFVLTAGVALAQRPARLETVPKPQAAPRFRQFCDFGDPRTRLEQLDAQIEKVIVRGSTSIGVIAGRNGILRVEAIELRDQNSVDRALGVVVTFREANQAEAEGPRNEIRSFIDYEEIDRLLKGFDGVARTDDTITKLANFETHYTTKDNLEIAGFRQTPSGAIAASASGGDCERVRILLSLDELAKLRYMILQAKTRLDEIMQ